MQNLTDYQNSKESCYIMQTLFTRYKLYLHCSLQSVSSVAQSCPTLCDPMNRSTPGLPVHHQLPEFTQTHVHRVGDAIQLSHPLSSPSPPAPNLSQHQGLFQWVSPSHEVPKYWSFSFSMSPSNEHPGLISSHAQLFATPWTAAHQAPLSMGFSRQGYWSGLPFPSPRDLPNPGIDPGSPALQADSLPSELKGKSDYDEVIFGDHRNYGGEACTWCTIPSFPDEN